MMSHFGIFHLLANLQTYTPPSFFLSVPAFLCLFTPSVCGAHLLALNILPFRFQLQFPFLPEALPPIDSTVPSHYSFKALITVSIYFIYFSHIMVFVVNSQGLGLSHVPRIFGT